MSLGKPPGEEGLEPLYSLSSPAETPEGRAVSVAQQPRQDQILIYCLLLLIFSSKIVHRHQRHPCPEGGPWRAMDQLKLQTCFLCRCDNCAGRASTLRGLCPNLTTRPLWAQRVLSYATGRDCRADAPAHRHRRCSYRFSFRSVPPQTRKGGISSPEDTWEDQTRRKKPVKILHMEVFRGCPLP